MDALPFALVESIVHLLGSVANMNSGLNDRRCALMDGLSRLIDADVWVWLQCRSDPHDQFSTAFHALDGGWRDDGERSAFFTALHDPQINRAINSGFVGRDHQTITRDRFLPEDDPQGAALLERWTAGTGLRECVLSFYPLCPKTFSGIGLHRRTGKPPFTPMQRAVVHLIISEVPWLHNDGRNIAANDDRLLKLSPREREVLLYLLEGDSRKQIALRLHLSHHTIADHMKSIYKQFKVNSRAELLALFMRNNISVSPGEDAR